MKRHLVRLVIGLFLLSLASSAWAAASCPLDSVLTFNIDSVLTEVTIYDYVVDTSRTTVWTVNPDGSRIGKSREESYSSTLKTMTASYEWDNTKNDWKGKAKSEYVYKYFAGKKMMISSTTFTWLNAAWVADKRFTRDYDSSARETEYFEYKRNTTTNILEPVNGHVYEWLNDGQKTLEEIYTTYSNGAWSAGTKQEWAFDEAGRQTLSTFYGTITNGNWVGTSKEEWGYTDSVLTMTAQYVWANDDWEGTLKEVWAFDTIGRTTLHEQFGWYNNDWSMTLRDIADFDEAGNQILIESYTGKDGVTTGTQKEEYTFDENGNKTLIIVYKWSKGAWVGSTHEITEYNGPKGEKSYYEKQVWRSGAWGDSIRETWVFDGPDGKQTLHEKYTWKDGAMVKYLEYTTEYEGTQVKRYENYLLENGVWTGKRFETWVYNGPSNKKTRHDKYDWEDGAWVLVLQDTIGYTGNYITLEESYERQAGIWTGTTKKEHTYNGSKKIQSIVYSWDNGAWVADTKDEWTPSSSKPTLHEQYTWDGSWTKTLEENTTYEGTNKILVENYALIEGVWTGTEKEKWTYESGHVTLHEQYAWDTDWIITLQENTAYEGANKVLVENYARVEGVIVGTEREVWGYTSGRQTLHETYEWYNNLWALTLCDIAAFDEEGNQILVESYTGSEGLVYGVKKEEYAFLNGEKIQTIIYTMSNGEWVYFTKNEIGYQDGNTEVSAANYVWNGEAWRGAGDRTYTTRDEENRITELLTKNWSATAADWTNSNLKQHTFDEDGIEVLTYNANWNGTDWVMSSMRRTDIIKDEEGHQLLKAQWKCSSNGKWSGVQKDTAAYTVSGKKLYEASFTAWKNNNWSYGTNSYEVTYAYDDKDSTVLLQRFRWKSNRWQGHYRYEYAYDAKGRQTLYAYYDDWNTSYNNWEGDTKRETTYNPNGKISEQIVYESYDSQNKKWNPTFKYIYTYDEQNREVETISQVYSDPYWINTNRSDKEYSGSKKVKENTYIWKDNKWVFSTRSEQYYDSDAQAKLRREVTGAWNNGTLASFTNNYYSYACDPMTIRFVNHDGTLLEMQTVYKGQIPEYTGETPTRTEEGKTYTFIGWTPDIVPANGNATYTATYSSRANQYTITFKDEDGTILDSRLWDYGATPTCTEPTKAADAHYTYSFAGWSPEVGAVTGEATYVATYSSTVNQYTVTFKDEDGTVLDSRLWDYGATPTCTEPTKQATDEYTYTFSGWSPAVVAVNGEAIYIATYSTTIRQYTVTFKDEDGTILDSRLWDYGATPTCTEPAKQATDEYTYTFAGWTPDVEAVNGEATYVATYSSTVNQYTVTFKDEDGTVLDSRLWDYGATPTCTEPTKAADAQYSYSFTGWTPAIETVSGEATYIAIYSSTVNQYTITFKDEDGAILDSRLWDYGATPTCNEPTKQATDEYTYTFSGWSPEVVSVTGEATYIASYSAAKNSYTITWLNDDGTEIEQTTVEYGVTPTHANIEKEGTAEYTYSFAGWSPTIVPVTGNATYQATFTVSKRSYLITFYYENGTTILDQVMVEYGATPATSLIPSSPSDAHYSYTFAGWAPEVVPVTGEASYVATYTAIPNKYTITFKNYNGRVLERTKVEYGATPEYEGETPFRPATASCVYEFAGWSPEIEVVSGDATYTAVFEGIINTYTIIFYDEDGITELDRTIVEHGQKPTTEVVPTKPEDEEFTYTFAGWNPKIVKATADASYVATYTATPKTTPEGVSDVNAASEQVTKVIIDGQIYILRGGQKYTIHGQLVEKIT